MNGYPIKDKRFEVLRREGTGAYGTTYKAFDLLTQRLCILKSFHDERLEQFRDAEHEYQALKDLHHPRIVRMYDVNTQNEELGWHLCMEYIPGVCLRDLLSTKAKNVSFAYRVGLEVADALQYLEEQGRLHRDLSPTNILCDEQGRGCTLIDFGFSALTDQSLRTIGGTIRPPELLLPQGKWDATADVYVLARLLYTLLTNRPWLEWPHEDTKDPFSPLVDPRRHNVAIPESLADVLCRAAHPEKDARFHTPTAAEFLRAWRHAGSTAQGGGIDAQNAHRESLLQIYRHCRDGYTGSCWKDSLYVETALDHRLLRPIVEGRYALVILSGNPGDGKTAFLERVKEELERRGANFDMAVDRLAGWRATLDGRHYVCNYDGLKSHGDRGADSLLEEFFAEFRTEAPPSTDVVKLLAINLGRLRDVVLAKSQTYSWLARDLTAALGLMPADESPASSWDRLCAINLNHRSLVGGEFAASEGAVFDDLLDKAYLRPEQWEVCDSCVARQRCAARLNRLALSDPVTGSRARSRLKALFQTVHVRDRFHVTFRDLRSACAYVIAGTGSCESIVANVKEGRVDDEALLADAYFNRAFNAADETDELLNELQVLDVADVSNPTLDRVTYARFTRDEALPQSLLPDTPSSQVYLDAIRRIADPCQRQRLLRRLVYFQATEDKAGLETSGLGNWKWTEMLPHRYTEEFWKCVRVGDPQRFLLLRSQLCQALSRCQGMYADEAYVYVRSGSVPHAGFAVYKRIPYDQFQAVPVPLASSLIETAEKTLRLRHYSGEPSLVIDLDLFEWLCRMQSGVVPAVRDATALFQDLQHFLRRLLLLASQDMVLDSALGRFLVRQDEQQRLVLQHPTIDGDTRVNKD